MAATHVEWLEIMKWKSVSSHPTKADIYQHIWLTVLGFNNTCGSFCVVSQRKGEEIEEIVEEMKEGDREEREAGMKVKKQKK